MLMKMPLPFAPEFYKLDISEVPVLIGGFAMGPLAAAIIMLIKILLNLILNGTMTAGIGELANFLIGCAFCVPASIIYKKMKNKKGAMLGMVIGTTTMTVVGGFLNAFVLLPTYAKVFGMSLEALVGIGNAINASITNLSTFIFLAVVPFNLIKGALVSIIVMLIYKRISPILTMNRH